MPTLLQGSNVYHGSPNAIFGLLPMIGGLFGVWIGVTMVADAINWMRKGRPVQGTVVDLRVSRNTTTPTYYPTIEVTEGETSRQLRSLTSDTVITGKIPGDTITVLVREDKPREFLLPAHRLSALFYSAIPLFLGLIFLRISLWEFRNELFKWLCVLALLGLVGHKLRSGWGTEVTSRFIIKNFYAEGRLKHLTGRVHLSRDEAIARQSAANKSALANHMVGLVLGALMAGISAFYITMTYPLVSEGVNANGVVSSLEVVTSKTGRRYKAHVTFQSDDGSSYQFKDVLSINPPAYTVGEQVGVFYEASNPRHAIIDRGFWWNWVIPFTVLAVGTLILLRSLWLLLAKLRA